MQALEDTLGNGTGLSVHSANGQQKRTTAIASYADLRVFPGDSFLHDHALGYTGPAATHVDRVPVGLPVGVAVGGSAVLAVTATLAFYIFRQRKHNKEQRVCACYSKSNACQAYALRSVVTFCGQAFAAVLSAVEVSACQLPSSWTCISPAIGVSMSRYCD